MTDARSLIMGSGSPSFSFNRFGDTITGQIITEPSAVQQKVFGTNELAFWPSGDPKMQVVFQVQTAWRNYEGIATPDRTRPDSGVRTIYIKGKHMEKSVKEAILAAGADWLDVGGWVQITYVTDDYESKAGIKPKIFDVKYQRGQTPQAPRVGLTQPAQTFQGNGYRPNDPGPVNPGPYGVVAAPVPNWQTPGWRPDAPVPQGPYPPQGNPFPQPPAPAQPAMPSHHGQPDQMPNWATGPASAPPVPSSAPPAPQLSTLEAIRAAQASGTPDYGSVQPAF